MPRIPSEEKIHVRTQLMALVESDVQVVRKHQDIMQVVVREFISGRKSTRRLVDESMRSFSKEVFSILSCAKKNGELGCRFDAGELSRLFLGQMTILYVEQWRSGGKYPTWGGLPSLLVDSFLLGAKADGRVG